MTFWDRLKPAARVEPPRQVDLSPEGRTVSLVWSETTTSASARRLRLACPCAACVDERSGQRTVRDDEVPTDLRVLAIRPVGQYALGFSFSDAHQSGIYDWRLLRSL